MRQVISNELIDKNNSNLCSKEDKTQTTSGSPIFQSLAKGAIQKSENNDLVRVTLEEDIFLSKKSFETIDLIKKSQEIEKTHTIQNTQHDNNIKSEPRLLKVTPLKRIYKGGDNNKNGETTLLKSKSQAPELNLTPVYQGKNGLATQLMKKSFDASCSHTQPCSIISGEWETQRIGGAKIIHPILSTPQESFDDISTTSDSEDNILSQKIDDTIAEFEIIFKDGSSILQESDVSTDDTFALYSPCKYQQNDNSQKLLKRIRSESFVSSLAAEYKNSGLDISVFDRTESTDIDDDLSFESSSIYDMSDSDRDLFEARRFALRNYNLLFDISNHYPMNLQHRKDSNEICDNDSHDLVQRPSLAPTRSFCDESSLDAKISTQHGDDGKIMKYHVLAFIDLIRAIIVSVLFHSLLLKEGLFWANFRSLGIFILWLLPAISKVNMSQLPCSKSFVNSSSSSNKMTQSQKVSGWIKYLLFSKDIGSLLVYTMAWCYFCEKVHNSYTEVKSVNTSEVSSQVFAIDYENELKKTLPKEDNGNSGEGISIQQNFDHTFFIQPQSSDSIDSKSTQYNFMPASIHWHNDNIKYYQKSKPAKCSCKLSDTLSQAKDTFDVKPYRNKLNSDIEKIIREFVKNLLNDMRRAVQKVILVIYDGINAMKLVAQKLQKTILGVCTSISNIFTLENNIEMIDTIYKIWTKSGID